MQGVGESVCCSPACWVLRRGWGPVAGHGSALLEVVWSAKAGGRCRSVLRSAGACRCCLRLLQAGCPCRPPQRLPSARAWGPLSGAHAADRRLAVAWLLPSVIVPWVCPLLLLLLIRVLPQLLGEKRAGPRMGTSCWLDGTRKKMLWILFRGQVLLLV